MAFVHKEIAIVSSNTDMDHYQTFHFSYLSNETSKKTAKILFKNTLKGCTGKIREFLCDLTTIA